jgi:8-oxo-dGTP pyrophosphatase MutT (NUDIX family)
LMSVTTHDELTRSYAVCAGCIVYRFVDDVCEVLLVKQKQARVAWGFPKGHVDPDEDWEEAAVRETLEETGVECTVEHMLTSTYCATPKEYKRIYTYLARAFGSTTPDPITVDEVYDVDWWPIDMLPDIHEYQLPVVIDAVEMLIDTFEL